MGKKNHKDYSDEIKSAQPSSNFIVPASPAPTPAVSVDYTKLTSAELMVEAGKAWDAKDMKLMSKLTRLVTQKEDAEAKAKKVALEAQLTGLVEKARARFDKLVEELTAFDEYDGADGFWYAKDFGDMHSVLRVLKSARKPAGEGGGGKSSYVANPAKSADLLAQVGENVMFTSNKEVDIDKTKHTIPAGTTFREAYDYSTNGGWRNKVRQALLKEAGLI